VRFRAEVELGNDAMRNASEVFEAFRVSLMVRRNESGGIFSPLEEGDSGVLVDANGNTVGRWTVYEDEVAPAEARAAADAYRETFGPPR